jgi:hypothetical protein
VGRLYSEPTSVGLLSAIDEWESIGCPQDPSQARARALALSRSVFRERMLKFLAEVLIERTQHLVPPPPHLNLGGA